jgi:hypothetical protein
MAYIPKDAKWYLADIIEEFRVAGERDNLIHKNTVLVRADSPEEAYDRAIKLGKAGEISYENSDGKLVTCTFRGLQNLQVIYEELEHGAELMYEQWVGLSEEEVARLVRTKQRLNVFLPMSPAAGPNIAARDIVEEAMTLLNARQEAGNDPA